jgi:hypothetical protein
MGCAALFAAMGTAAALAQDTAQNPGGAEKPPPGEEKKPAAKPLPQISPDARYDYQGQATFVLQHLFKFDSPYEGPNSFRSRDETELSHSYTLFLGARLVKNLEIYINPEIAWGNGLSNGTGLAAYVNGDLNGQPTLRPEPYVARYFVRWRVPMPRLGKYTGKAEAPAVLTGRSPNIIEGLVPVHRLIIQLGKLAVTDVFDINSYANDQRNQFLNTAFVNNLAYDSPQEPRTYDLGGTVAWVNPGFSLRFGEFAMPTVPGGPDLAYGLDRSHSEHLELELHPRLLRAPMPPSTLRLLGYRNTGTMGRYRDALDAQPAGMPPALEGVRRSGQVRYGFGLNFEQALADGGDTGVFARLGWADGALESITSEADCAFSIGAQLSGAHWGRKEDRIGFAFGQSDIGGAHRAYLAAGGEGLSVGDGRLHYDSERVLEAYYLFHVRKALTLTLDYQFVANPGYNRDRGPASVIALRTLLAF